LKSYREIENEILEEIKGIAAETELPIDKVFAVRQATQAQAAKREETDMANKTEVSRERAAAVEALPGVLTPFRENGTRPSPRDVIAKLGLPPTKSNLGWVAYQLRLAYQPSAVAAE